MISLRPYQISAIDKLREKFQQGKRKIIIHMPCGTGKGLAMSHIVKTITDKGIPIISVMAGRDLIFQTRNNYHKYFNIISSMIMGNEPGFYKDSLSQICSIDTLRARDIEFVKKIKYIIVDECHMTNADRYQNFFSSMAPDAYYIGFTATPYNYLKFWEDVICPINPVEARDHGFLSPVIHYAPKDQIDVSQVKISAGEFNQTQLEEQSSKIIGDIPETWKKFADGRPTVCFGVNKNHSQMIADEFNKKGIKAIHLDESDNKYQREDALSKIKSGEIKIICNVNIFSIGIDVPEISCGILARPTMSEVLYIQQAGRILRTCKNKQDSIILDHAGNIMRHGAVYETRQAKLATNPKDKNLEKIIRVTTCEMCYAVRPSGQRECPYCGYSNPTQSREIEHIEGELTTVDYIDNKYLKMKNALRDLEEVGKWKGWKPVAKYFKLFEMFGDDVFKYSMKLKIPNYMLNILVSKNPNEQKS